MSTILTAGDVRACVCEQLAVVLSLPLESIQPESRIVLDLGAESLDLVDLTFRLEDALHIRLDARRLPDVLDSDEARGDFRERFTVEALSVYLQSQLDQAHAGT